MYGKEIVGVRKHELASVKQWRRKDKSTINSKGKKYVKGDDKLCYIRRTKACVIEKK